MAKFNSFNPIFIDGKPARVVFRFERGSFVAVREDENYARQFDKNGRPNDSRFVCATNEAPLVTEVVSLYPSGGVYVKDVEVRSSMYGVKNLIQVRVTRRGDQIVKKELLP